MEWRENHFSGGVNYWNQWCLLPSSGLQSLWTLSITSLETIWLRRECIFLCSFVLWVRAWRLWGWTDETGVRMLFLGRQSLTCTVNDFSRRFRVIDNHNERVGWELLAHFFNAQWMAEKVCTSPLSCCAVHVFHLRSNVKRSALGQSDDGFPSWQLPLFQRSTWDEKGGGGGGECVWGQKPHVKWGAAKWLVYSSSSGLVVLERWVDAGGSGKKLTTDNPSAQLRSYYGIRRTDPLASRNAWKVENESERETLMTEAKGWEIVTQCWSKDLLIHGLFGTKTKSFVSLTDRQNQCRANLYGNSNNRFLFNYSCNANVDNVSIFIRYKI